MNGCPFHALKPGLPVPTERIAKLPVDVRGYPVPWFVTWIDGQPEFRVADGRKWAECVKLSLCWVCGEKLGKWKVFPIGPMCAITRTTSEPPVHLDCAEYSVKACPFLSKPAMSRRENGEAYQEIKEHTRSAGIAIKRNPGVTAVWVTDSFEMFGDGKGGRLIEVGLPQAVSWWREGRPATRVEVLESVNSGLPLLREQCEIEGQQRGAQQGKEAHADLDQRIAWFEQFLPKEAA